MHQSPSFALADPRDVDGLMISTERLYEAAVGTLRSLGERAGDLMLMRESDHHDLLDAEGLIAQLAGLFSEVQGASAVAALGVEPLVTRSNTITVEELDAQSGRKIKTTIHLEHIRVGSTRAVLFCYRGTYYLYSLASAATLDEMGNQEWTQLLIQILTRLRPRRLRSVNISRFTRNQEVAGLLLHACSRHVDEVWAGRLQLHMRGERAPMDKLLFTMLAMAASLERDAIVSRMMAGKVNKVLRGEWLPGAHSVPFGYVLDGKRLVPDPTMREQVRELLLAVIAEPPAQDFARRLGQLGARIQPVEGTGLPSRNMAFSRGARGKWLSVLAYLPLYATGEHVVRLPNPFPGALEVAGRPVVMSAAGVGEVQLVSRPGVPEGGWASPEILEAALAVAMRKSGDRAAGSVDESTAEELADPDMHGQVASRQELRKPKKQKAPRALLWSGTQWDSSEPAMRWLLRGRASYTYELMRWPIVTDDTDDTDDTDNTDNTDTGHTGDTELGPVGEVR